MDIILASTSRYRRALLARLVPDFACEPPGVDETPLPDEAPFDLALRLARAKAEAVAARYPGALVIGSDQVASLQGRIQGKPGTLDAAAAQLRASSGRRVAFHTGLAVVAPGIALDHVEPFHAHFRVLSEADIGAYLGREPALDCAGSFKVEGLGIALFTRLEGTDPTALEGLPLIALTGLLRQAGINVLNIS
ncbi:MAG: septum formation inhibitor Maf [Halioglobus sp.]|nr:septum formation inhibitor Maf [Halioglobus sp.]